MRTTRPLTLTLTLTLTLLLSLALSLALSGCFTAGVLPRTGDISEPGQVHINANFTVATIERGDVQFESGSTYERNTGTRYLPHPLGWLIIHYLNSVAAFRWAATDDIEFGFILGVQEQGLELRYGLLDEDRGAPLSIAASIAPVYRPMMRSDTLGVRAQLDFSSRRIGRAVPLLNLAVSYGPEAHASGVPGAEANQCGSFGDPGCSEYGPGQQLSFLRQEVRVTTVLGLAIQQRDNEYRTECNAAGECLPSEYVSYLTGTAVIVSVAPYFTPWSELTEVDCLGCSTRPVDLDADFGVHLNVSVAYSPRWGSDR